MAADVSQPAGDLVHDTNLGIEPGNNHALRIKIS